MGERVGHLRAARGPQRLGRDALGVERRIDTVEDERDHLGDDVAGGSPHVRSLALVQREIVGRERRQVERELAAERDRDDAGSRSTQPVGVARAGWLLAQPERGGDAVELVGERDERPGKAAGGRGTGGVGQVLLADRLGDRLGQAGPPCIDGADVALELGELADEPRGLVRLGEPRRHQGVLPRLGIARDLVREHGDERLDARRLVGERPGAGVEADAAESAREALQPDLEVLRERERRVVETAADDPLVARDHRLRRVGPRVGDEAEVRPGTPFRGEQREVPLVALHDRDDHAVGEIEEPLRERAAQHARPLREVHDLAHDAPPDPPSRDARRARARSPRGADLHRPSRRPRTALLVASASASSTSPARKRWPRDVRPERTLPSSTSMTSLPCRQTSQRIGREKRSCSLPQRMFFGNARPSTRPWTTSGSTSEAGRASASTSANTNPSRAHERAGRHVVAAREARAGRRRLAVGPEGHRLRRAAVHETIGGLATGTSSAMHRDAPRRDERPDASSPRGGARGAGARRAARPAPARLARARRQLLAPDLDEERAHASTGGSTMARCACATLRARFRTRPM